MLLSRKITSERRKRHENLKILSTILWNFVLLLRDCVIFFSETYQIYLVLTVCILWLPIYFNFIFIKFYQLSFHLGRQETNIQFLMVRRVIIQSKFMGFFLPKSYWYLNCQNICISYLKKYQFYPFFNGL